MKINDFIQQGNVNVTFSLNDLKEFFKDFIKEYIPEKEERYLTREEVSEMLKVSETTLWRWEKEKYLLPVHIGGKVWYKASDINKLFNL
jgi:predicted DNA-binding transcriptional regulator AlpA